MKCIRCIHRSVRDDRCNKEAKWAVIYPSSRKFDKKYPYVLIDKKKYFPLCKEHKDEATVVHYIEEIPLEVYVKVSSGRCRTWF